eukprot:COSAG02_NODE_36410_length_454_cov_283.076056_1_plen_28_part_10
MIAHSSLSMPVPQPFSARSRDLSHDRLF